ASGNIGLQSLNYISYYPEAIRSLSHLINFNLRIVYTSELFCQAVLTFLCALQEKSGFIKPFSANTFLFVVFNF
ncbi:MAG: hypothetical protein AAB736_02910, partial [Patescibacteria group bacterium]